MSTSEARSKTERTLDDVSQGAHDTIDSMEDRARDGIEFGRRKAQEAVSTVEDLGAAAELTIESTTQQVTRYVQEKPLQAAGIAFAAGVLTTLFLRRS